MLSDAIREMRTRIGAYEHTGIQMAPEGVAGFVAMLAAFETEAANYEATLAAVRESMAAVREPDR